jgi:hypothetical protein
LVTVPSFPPFLPPRTHTPFPLVSSLTILISPCSSPSPSPRRDGFGELGKNVCGHSNLSARPHYPSSGVLLICGLQSLSLPSPILHADCFICIVALLMLSHQKQQWGGGYYCDDRGKHEWSRRTFQYDTRLSFVMQLKKWR